MTHTYLCFDMLQAWPSSRERPVFNDLESGSESEMESEEAELLVWECGPPADRAEEETQKKANELSNFLMVALLSWASRFNVTSHAFRLIFSFLTLVVTQGALSNPCLSAAVTLIPPSIYMAKKQLGISKTPFDQYCMSKVYSIAYMG